MTNAIYFKWLQRKNRFRNPESIIKKTENFQIQEFEKKEIQCYLDVLEKNQISYTYPLHENYPEIFYMMKEPPLFLEYIGAPIWKQTEMFSVVGSRKCHPLTQRWIQTELFQFLTESKMTLVSGGARGVDQSGHLCAVKAQVPTIVVLPSGLNQIYPDDLTDLKNEILYYNGCFISEFEINQKVQKSFFYLRNRLIAALGSFCFVLQAGQKSGTMLTVHHALEFGRQVLTIPAHPMLSDFSGNIILAQDGAGLIYQASDLHSFWQAESWSGPARKKISTTDGVKPAGLAL